MHISRDGYDAKNSVYELLSNSSWDLRQLMKPVVILNKMKIEIENEWQHHPSPLPSTIINRHIRHLGIKLK